MKDLKANCDAVLSRVTSGSPRVPGVVAMVTDRDGDIYAGSAGDRRLGDGEMSLDTVFAIFSTTKAIAGTTALQCVEEGLLDLDAPAASLATGGLHAHLDPRRPPRQSSTQLLAIHV